MSIILLKYLAKLPFKILYLLSGFFYFVVYHLIGYRKHTVIDNLTHAFPEKPKDEIHRLCRKFYRHFCDLTLEIIKLHSMTESDFSKRVTIRNTEMMHAYYEQGIPVVVLAMHYNNWEWSSYIPTHLRHKSLAVYKPLHNTRYNTYISENRSRLGAEMVPGHKVLKRVLEARRDNEVFSLWLAGDQTPPLHHKFWLTFLNRDALFYPGPAVISRRFNYPVIFQKVIKTGRGRYDIIFELLIENPKNYSEASIIRTYIRKMEEVIKERPEYYLWSHKRWKHKRPEGVPLQS